MELAKLDSYDYIIISRFNSLVVTIRLSMSGIGDADIVDILSEVHNSGGSIYIDREYYEYLNEFKIFKNKDKTYLDLKAKIHPLGS